VKLIEAIKYGSSFSSAAAVLARFEGKAAYFFQKGNNPKSVRQSVILLLDNGWISNHPMYICRVKLYRNIQYFL